MDSNSIDSSNNLHQLLRQRSIHKEEVNDLLKEGVSIPYLQKLDAGDSSHKELLNPLNQGIDTSSSPKQWRNI